MQMLRRKSYFTPTKLKNQETSGAEVATCSSFDNDVNFNKKLIAHHLAQLFDYCRI